MKVRIGIGLGGLEPSRFVGAVQCMERCGFDSLWLSEVLTTGVLDPLSGLAFAAGVTTKLKLGTTMTVTARNPVRMAKELATIDRLSNGRLLLVFVPGLTNRVEDQALGVPVKERGAWLDEILPLTRRLWSEDNVTHQGPLFCYDGPGITLQPRPLQNPLEVWLGGNDKRALRRAGRLSDGWLPQSEWSGWRVLEYEIRAWPVAGHRPRTADLRRRIQLLRAGDFHKLSLFTLTRSEIRPIGAKA